MLLRGWHRTNAAIHWDPRRCDAERPKQTLGSLKKTLGFGQAAASCSFARWSAKSVT